MNQNEKRNSAPSENLRVTKYVITSPECTDILPSDISTVIYESGYDVDIKETCFGAIINGEDDVIKEAVKKIRALDPPGIFIKDRGFPLGDHRRCRGDASGSPCKLVWLTSGRRSGSVRPGCYMIECESKILPLISRALASQAKEELEYPEKADVKAKNEPQNEEIIEGVIKRQAIKSSALTG
jgi:hypothetical protein